MYQIDHVLKIVLFAGNATYEQALLGVGVEVGKRDMHGCLQILNIRARKNDAKCWLVEIKLMITSWIFARDVNNKIKWRATEADIICEACDNFSNISIFP